MLTLAIEPSIEELMWVREARTCKEGKSDAFLQDIPYADNPMVFPDRRTCRVTWAAPLQLLDYLKVGFMDDSSELRKRCAAPIGGLRNQVVDEINWIGHHSSRYLRHFGFRMD
jgi:hypothetical protein